MIFCCLRRYNSKIQEFVSRRTFSSRIIRVKNQSPFVDGAKRFYNWGSSNNNQVHEFGRRKRWMWNLETSVVLALFSGLVGFDIYLGWETVPFTRRRQFLLIPTLDDESRSGNREYEQKYEQMKKDMQSIILPPLHPDSVRVHTILRDLIEAFRRREGDARIKKAWEALIVDIPGCFIRSSSGGKIVIASGILGSCEEDAGIAAFIAPEIGRVAARHAMERISISGFISNLFMLILHVFVSSMPSLSKYFRFAFARSLFYYITWKVVFNLLTKIYSLKMDLEADHIGLMLLASAGFDPRVAFQAREKMASIKDASRWEKVRARLLVLDMEEALSIYEEVTARQDA